MSDFDGSSSPSFSPEPGPCRRLLEEILDLGCSEDIRGMAYYELAELLLLDGETSEGTLRSHLQTIRLYAEARRQRVLFSDPVEDIFGRLVNLLEGPGSAPGFAAMPPVSAACPNGTYV